MSEAGKQQWYLIAHIQLLKTSRRYKIARILALVYVSGIV